MLPLLLATAVAVGTDTADCRPRTPAAPETPYTAGGALALAGRYDLTLVATTGRPGWNATGLLELEAADSVHRWTVAPLSGDGQRRPGADRPLWGWAELSGNLFADLATLARRDPDHPAAVLLSDGMLLLTWARPEIFHLELRVEHVSRRGFRGRWVARDGLERRVHTGPPEGPVTGYFCATRRAASGPPGA